jgi:hypothetical protein
MLGAGGESGQREAVGEVEESVEKRERSVEVLGRRRRMRSTSTASFASRDLLGCFPRERAEMARSTTSTAEIPKVQGRLPNDRPIIGKRQIIAAKNGEASECEGP